MAQRTGTQRLVGLFVKIARVGLLPALPIMALFVFSGRGGESSDAKYGLPAPRWQGDSTGTAKLVLFAMNVQSVEEKLFVDWRSQIWIRASRGSKSAAYPKVPASAETVRQKRLRNLPPGKGETYMHAIYALSKQLSAQRGFDPRNCAKKFLDISGNVGVLPAVYAQGRAQSGAHQKLLPFNPKSQWRGKHENSTNAGESLDGASPHGTRRVWPHG